ncbi:hypothetical protein BDZ89DRAFT_1048015 [Hymenopellis radicata]|nr:hypothetical protein BDZ89DRAFT_1048015 [Hymenopellis radicata]
MIPQLRLPLFGTGLSWDEVYAALDPYGVNVVGARVPDPGVAGLEVKYRAISGYLMLKCPTGLSWFTNQYGLTLDTIMAIELIQPNSTVSNITQESDPDLFFALKARNSIHIVRSYIHGVASRARKTTAFPQGQVWGGPISADEMASVNTATVRFHEVTDPKAEPESHGYGVLRRTHCAIWHLLRAMRGKEDEPLTDGDDPWAEALEARGTSADDEERR